MKRYYIVIRRAPTGWTFFFFCQLIIPEVIRLVVAGGWSELGLAPEGRTAVTKCQHAEYRLRSPVMKDHWLDQRFTDQPLSRNEEDDTRTSFLQLMFPSLVDGVRQKKKKKGLVLFVDRNHLTIRRPPRISFICIHE